MSDEIEEETGPAVRLLGRFRPQDAKLTYASMVKFLKLAHDHELVVQVQATFSEVADEFYAQSNKTRRGEIKKPGYQRENVFITITNLTDFAVQATWFGGTFDHAFVGGPRSGHRPPKLYSKNQVTALMEEIVRCLQLD